MNHLTHETVEGERWDQLAYRYYGDANRTDPIIKANRKLFGSGEGVIPSILPFGLSLIVPILDQAEIDQSLLPPWKRTLP